MKFMSAFAAFTAVLTIKRSFMFDIIVRRRSEKLKRKWRKL